jgi:hypothetical protein
VFCIAFLGFMMKKEQAAETVSCEEPALGDLFPFFLNGEVTPEEAKRIEKHLTVCGVCQKELALWLAMGIRGLPSWQRGSREGR